MGIQKRGSVYQLTVKHRLLPRPFYATFDTEIEAASYRDQMLSLLARGVVPNEWLSKPKSQNDALVVDIIDAYAKESHSVTDSDKKLLNVIKDDAPVIGTRFSAVTYRWVEDYVSWLKSAEKNITPSSIRKRIGTLARCVDWHIKRVTPNGESPQVNAFRLLPKGYSAYIRAEPGATVRRDQERDRRLTTDEAARIEAALSGFKRVDRQRKLTDDPAFALLYRLIVDTGLRLFEAYRLRVESFDFTRGIIHVEGSKGHRGYIKPRTVPIRKHLREPLQRWCVDRSGEDLMFPFWDGLKDSRPKTAGALSRRFGTLFAYADVPHFTEHDLRHEAACRWFELRRNDGAWVFSDIEICRIMGWTSMDMALRYASLRGEDLASRLE